MKEVKKLVLKKETITSLGGDEMNLLRVGATCFNILFDNCGNHKKRIRL